MKKTATKINKFDNKIVQFKNLEIFAVKPIYLIMLKLGRMTDKDIVDIERILRKEKITGQNLDNAFKDLMKNMKGEKTALEDFKENYEGYVQNFLWPKAEQIKGIMIDIEENHLNVFLYGQKELLKWHNKEKTAHIQRLIRDIKQLFPHLKFVKSENKKYYETLCKQLLKLFEDYKNNRNIIITDQKINQVLDKISEAFN